MASFFLAAPALFSLLIAARRSDYHLRWVGWLIIVIVGIAPAGLPAAIGMGLWYSVGYGLAAYGAAAVMLLRLIGRLPDAAIPILRLSLFLSGVAVVFVVPLTLSGLRDFWHRPSSASGPSQVDLSFMGKSIGRIENSMTGVVNNIQEEQARIAAATQQLRQELDKGATRIREMQEENARMEKELHEKRALLAIDADKVAAIEAAIAHVSGKERVIAFVLGFLSSLAVAYITRK